jgi:hypothetical protein
MSSQPEEEDKQKQTHFLFRKTDVLGYEFPNIILILAVIFMVYLLCRDPTKTVSQDLTKVYDMGITAGRNAEKAVTGSAGSAGSQQAPILTVGGSGLRGGGRGKFQFDY